MTVGVDAGFTVAGTPTGRGVATLPGPAGPGLPAIEQFGTGPAVVLVHGVGVGPDTFAALADAVVAGGHQAVVVHRPGYGLASAPAAVSLADQVTALAALVDALTSGSDAGDARGGVAGVIGVSGGATLALLLALRLAAEGVGVVPIVAHEPLLGPLAPALHHRVRRAVSALGAAGRPVRPVATTGFVRRLAGEATWARLPASERDAVAERSALVADEARAFAEVAPTASRPRPAAARHRGHHHGGRRQRARAAVGGHGAGVAGPGAGGLGAGRRPPRPGRCPGGLRRRRLGGARRQPGPRRRLVTRPDSLSAVARLVPDPSLSNGSRPGGAPRSAVAGRGGSPMSTTIDPATPSVPRRRPAASARSPAPPPTRGPTTGAARAAAWRSWSPGGTAGGGAG